MKFLCAVLLVCAIEAALSQEVTNGPCPTVTPQAGIDNEQFLGLWNGYVRVPFNPTTGTKCNHACYTLNNGVLSVTNKFVSLATGESATFAPFIGAFTAPGKFTVNIGGVDTPFTILAANDVAASIFSCIPSNDGTVTINKFGITRSNTPSEAAIAFARSGFTNNGISLEDTTLVDQTDCPVPQC